MKPVKHINNGGRVEVGANPNDEGIRRRLFKGSIVPIGLGSDGLASSLIEAERGGPDCFEASTLDLSSSLIVSQTPSLPLDLSLLLNSQHVAKGH